MIRPLRPFWLLSLLLCSACASGPRPLALPDGLFRSEINPPIDLKTRASTSDLATNITEEGGSTQLAKGADELNPLTAKLALPPSEKEVVVAIPEQIWHLQKGETIRSELTKWAKDSGWSLVWQLDKDWVIPSDSEFTGSFDLAAAKVVETLSSNGILIHANFFNANKTLVITGPGVTPQ